jgi:hypothetical protein
MKCKHCKHKDECADDAFINGAEFSPEFDGQNGCAGFEAFTNADRIRAMSDEELAKFVAEKIVNIESYKMSEQGHTPTATQLSAFGHTCYCTLVQWLRMPAEGE